MSFLGIRALPASCSRSSPLLRKPLTPSPQSFARRRVFSSNISLRDISTSSSAPARQAIGRITPKRIAIPLPRGSGSGGGGGGGTGIPKATIWQPILFCLALGGGSFVFAAEYTNADTQKWADRLGAGKWWRRGQGQPTDREITRAKTLEAAKSAQETANSLPQTLSFLPKPIVVSILRIYVLTKEYFLNTPPAQLVPLEIVGVMGGVFLAWKVPRFQSFMRRWFLHHPVMLGGSKAKIQESVTLFTSIISHQNLAHFAFNSIALTSFGAAAYSYLASPPPGETPLPSSTHTPHFLAFLLAAGLFSSLSSHLYTNLVRLPRLIRSLTNPARLSSAQALAAHEAILPGLGASGALYAAVTVTACAYPDTGIALIFLPFFSMPIGLGVAGMVTLDLIGLFRGWRMFDHVAHLGGAAFGVIYYQYGRQFWLWLRKAVGAGNGPALA